MPNKKLKDKLIAKRSIIVQLKATQKSTSAFALGALAFKALNVSASRNPNKHGLPCYGKYINPFPEFDGKIRNLSHSEFRRGFNLTRRPKPIVIETVVEA